MINFVVTVLCIVNVGSRCPIPNGHQESYRATSKEQCVQTAKSIISVMGYAAADFKIVCKEK